MIAAATMPRPGAANGVVPKERDWDRILDRRRPGQRRHREGHSAQGDRGRDQPIGNPGCAKQGLRHRDEHKKRDEQADATIGNECTGEHDGQYCSARPQPRGHEFGDRRDRTTVFHQLAE
jgi:hypothetical protein